MVCIRPRPGVTWCLMMTGSVDHQWSPDGLRWFEPHYIDRGGDLDQFSGGSDDDWPKNVIPGDERRRLSVWGSGEDDPKLLELDSGGCCAGTKSESSVKDTWKQPYVLEYAVSQSDAPETERLTIEVASNPVRTVDGAMTMCAAYYYGANGCSESL